MLGAKKAFNQELFDQNDNPDIREIVKKFWLTYRSKSLADNPNPYEVDLVETIVGGDRVEIERRTNWTGGLFPFLKVNVMERKGKYLAFGDFHYVVMANNNKRLGVLAPDKVRKYFCEEYAEKSPNKYQNNEFVYKIPRSEFEWHDLP